MLIFWSMATKNHKQSMTQPERSFWRDVVIADLSREGRTHSIQKRIERASDLADLAVAELRARITWRQQ
jgi:hypothetical protein